MVVRVYACYHMLYSINETSYQERYISMMWQLECFLFHHLAKILIIFGPPYRIMHV